MEDVARFVKGYVSHVLLEEQEKEKTRRRAVQNAKKLALILADRYGVSRVYLFGSAVRRGSFGKRSDIDLAVQGLDKSLYLEALSYLAHQTKFIVDLVELEGASDSLRDRILAEGKDVT